MYIYTRNFVSKKHGAKADYTYVATYEALPQILATYVRTYA